MSLPYTSASTGEIMSSLAGQQLPAMELPCLAFHLCGRSTPLFSAPEQKRITAAGDMEEILKGKVVCPTAQGHLLVRDPATAATFLCDPRNGDKTHLPPLRGVEGSVLVDSHCLLSGEPASPGCVVLLVEPDDTSIWYVRPGDDDRWVKHDYDIGTMVLDHDEGLQEKEVICPMAACRGKFYFNSLPTELGVLEFCPGPVFSSIEIDDTIAADGSYGCEDGGKPRDVHLVESDGELYMVNLLCTNTRRDRIYRASVHRMDFAEGRWRKVKDLGGRVFLLSLFYFGASCSGGHGLRKDCVYMVYPVKKAMLVFDVEEGTIEMRNLDDEVPASDKAFWVLPTNCEE
ncbi:uncharacterized protein LOC120675771 [Panicum virgatum]|uniref:KIB1-4 beta-propeller domain-containing protein n=1 Tax=Panicum virgatum TaxID=38727 RepID=A0A8T0S7N5_PANVG|nr:uncharacterized protein LOC120675771 [Panicum virgatum]KAG2593614.1 hypothetical protein PVAP13_5NG012531 [Panicum virgatum]